MTPFFMFDRNNSDKTKGSLNQMKLTKKTAERIFKDQISEMGNVPTHDKIYMREVWSAFTDRLCKSGYITDSQYQRWSNPY